MKEIISGPEYNLLSSILIDIVCYIAEWGITWNVWFIWFYIISSTWEKGMDE